MLQESDSESYVKGGQHKICSRDRKLSPYAWDVL